MCANGSKIVASAKFTNERRANCSFLTKSSLFRVKNNSQFSVYFAKTLIRINCEHVKKITLFTLLYCLLPTCFFIYYWVKPLYAFLSLLTLFIVFVIALNQIRNLNDVTGKERFTWTATLTSSAIIAFLVCFFSEFGVFDYQSYDYHAHNYKFNLLTTQPLPLYDTKRDIYMCYYLGYYMVPSLLGKLTSISLVKYFVFAWSWIGLSLTFCWIQLRLSHLQLSHRVAVCMLLVLGTYTSTLIPLLGTLLSNSTTFHSNSVHINGTFILNQFPLFSRNWSESTQHALPALLGTAFFLVAIREFRLFTAFSVFLFGTLFWTPFTGIGLSVFYFYYFLKKVQHNKRFFLQFIGLGSLLLLAFSPVLLFLLGSAATNMASNKMIWQSGSSYWMIYYLLYLFVFGGVWLILFRRRLLEFDKNLLLLAFLSMALLALLQVGQYNDLNNRAVIASQTILGISVAYMLVIHFKLFFRNVYFTIGVLFWTVNLISFGKFYYERFFILTGGGNTTIENPKIKDCEDNYYAFLEHAYAIGKEAVMEYSLSNNSLFKRYLLKEPAH